MIVALIDAYKLGCGGEPICRVLRDHTLPIAASTYYAFQKWPPSAPSLPEVRSPDLVRRAWFRDAPDLVWVADFTLVHTRGGWMHVSFLQEGLPRRILGFTVAETTMVEFVSRTLLQAVSARRRANLGFVAEGVIARSDAGW